MPDIAERKIQIKICEKVMGHMILLGKPWVADP